MKTRNPITALTMQTALVWFACAAGGPLLTFVDIPLVAQAGKALILMSLGYLLFGLGLERKGEVSPARQSE